MVFLPSMRYGSLSVDMSNQPNFALPDSTSRAQSLIRPLTRQTAAPWSAISLRLISGVSSGQKQNASRPARAAYAAMAAPALPLVGMASRRAPRAFANETATARPRALNEPVGRRDSSLTIGGRKPAGRGLCDSAMRGDSTWQRLTNHAGSSDGDSPCQRHN